MCDLCVIDSVKQRMLSRRDMFRLGAGGAAAAAVATAAGTPPALAAGHGQVSDMTHTLSEEFPTFGGSCPASPMTSSSISPGMATTSIR
jgi:hypothetical protein